MDADNWRSHVRPNLREKVMNSIMDSLKRHYPFKGQDKLQQLKRLAARFEEMIYTAATSQGDYLKKIAVRLHSFETKAQNTMVNSVQSNPVTNNNISPDPVASHGMESQVNNRGQPHSIPMETNQTQACQQSQHVQNNIGSIGAQGSSSLTSALHPIGIMNQTSIPDVVCQNSNLQNIHNMPGASQILVGNSMGQGLHSNVFPNSQRQMQRRQQVVTEHQQQQSQNQRQDLYTQQVQERFLKQNFQQGNISHSLMQSHIQQQQQQQQQNPLESSPLPGIQQNQESLVQKSTQPLLQQQHPQPVIRQQQQPQQAPIINQHKVSVQQQLRGHQPNATNMQQNQQSGQRNSIPGMQQPQQQRQQQQPQQQRQQQQHRLLGHQNKISNLQEQQLTNDLLDMHHQQLGPQSISGPQQQQMHRTQSLNSSMHTNQPSVHMLQHAKVPMQQQQEAQQSATTVLPTRAHQSQAQPPQQRLMSQIQSQPAKLKQPIGLQQQSTPLQQDIQQRHQTSGSLLQPQNVIDQKNQLFQSERTVSEPPISHTGNLNGEDWKEEVYLKMQAMKETYLPDLKEMSQRIAGILQQTEQPEMLKGILNRVEGYKALLQIEKTNIQPTWNEKLAFLEKRITVLLSLNRSPALKQEQVFPSHMHSMERAHQPQCQVSQLQPHENHMNSQTQSMNLQGSVRTLQQNNETSLQHNSLSSSSPDSSAPHNTTNPMLDIPTNDSCQGHAVNSSKQVAGGSLQKYPVGVSQQVTINSLPSQSGNALQLSPLQANSSVLQQQHLKKQQEQHMLQAQDFKQQFQQHAMQQQLSHKQQLLQHQQQWQQKKQQPAPFKKHQISQLHQVDEVNDLKMRQQMAVKSGVFQQRHSAGQPSAHQHQQLMSGALLPLSSPQLLQAASPQTHQHPSPQIDQINLLTSLAQAGTPVNSAKSPFVEPSPSTPLAPFQLPGEFEKVEPGMSSLSSGGNIGIQPTTGALAPPQSLAIGTPGMSSSPLLAEFTSPNGNHIDAFTISGRSSVTENALELLIKVVKSVSEKTLSSSVDDIGSVVNIIDRTAGSAPGNGTRAAVGEDLVATTKCRLQAIDFIRQDGASGKRKMRHFTSVMPLNGALSPGIRIDSFKQLTGSEVSDLELTATSCVKRHRTEANHAIVEEIREINQQLIDTVVDISYEDAAAEGGEGTIVKFSFKAVSLGPNLRSQYASAQPSSIRPLLLVVPKNYPNCSPIFLDKFPVEVSNEYDLSVKAESRFSLALRSLSQPMSLGEIAKTWDVCARETFSEYAQQNGGGGFSSKYGSWEYCVSAA